MARITVEDCLTHENNRFALVLLASKRTKQLLEGASVLLDRVRNKPVVNSLREIAAGKVRFMNEDDRARVEERERREREVALARVQAERESIFKGGPEAPVDNNTGGLDAATAASIEEQLFGVKTDPIESLFKSENDSDAGDADKVDNEREPGDAS